MAGLITAGRLNSGNPTAGGTYDMDSIAAAIVGGTLMSGGEGSVVGTLLGALLLGVIRNSLVMLKIDMYWQVVVIGLLIITVCGMDHMANKSKNAK
jgi:ribose transport system permease protein